MRYFNSWFEELNEEEKEEEFQYRLEFERARLARQQAKEKQGPTIQVDELGK